VLVRAPATGETPRLPDVSSRWADANAGTGRTRPLHSDVVSLPGGTPPRGRRIGLFGGTFDPPHVGHLVTAVNVRHTLELDPLILMVNNVPWQKEGDRPITPPLDRLAMVEAAIADISGLAAGRLEIDKGGPSYTADTLATMRETEPGAELFTIVGDDAAAGMLTWERWEEVVALSTVVVVDRPGPHVELPTEIPWIRVEVPRLEVSSTDLRARFTDGRPLDYLLTDPVLDVIRSGHLYGVPA
jgi:nicotinate-nucleotide adenylyltransferase